jgi:hypothetical protein
MKKQHIFILLFNLLAGTLFSQPETNYSLSNSTLAGDNLPFWLWANRYGKVDPSATFLNLTEAGGTVSGTFSSSNLNYRVGTLLVGGLGEQSYFQVNQLYAGIGLKGWQLTAGLFADEIQFGGLSTTNGNLVQSLNARPYPKIRFSTNGYKTSPFAKNWLSFRLEYDEGLLNDNRYVEGVHLHHKSFYLKIQPQPDWNLQLGAEHFVMWGGTSPDELYGKMPTGFRNYIRYVMGSMGSEDFPLPEQQNVAGNHYGTYQIKLSKSFETFSTTLNISHPFEDFSGVNWRNWPDKLIGVYFERKQQDKLINAFIYEFVNTRQQGVVDSLFVWNEEEQYWYETPYDNYFNHGIYNSGVTYHQMAMCSPLFAPVLIDGGLSRGFGSNRFYAHHFGITGNLAKYINWKGLATYSHHLGTYAAPYNPEKEQLSLFFDVLYSGEKLPFAVGVSIAADKGQFYKKRIGAQLTLSKSW